MSNITVIVPIHKYDDEVASLLEDAVNSVPNDMNVRLSCPKSIEKSLNEWCTGRKNVSVFSTSDESDFATLVNQAIDDTEYFSILEFDDEYTPTWFNNVQKYISEQPETSVFLPLEDLVDYTTKEYIGYGNEAPWASSFSNEIGFIDLDCLQNFFNFYMTGSVFNTKDWKKIGGLKKSIKLTFWYEFLLRMTSKGKKIFVIPKVGYVHYLKRKGSVLDEYINTMDEKESEFWYNIAKQEYLFKDDRGKTYNPDNNKKEN